MLVVQRELCYCLRRFYCLGWNGIIPIPPSGSILMPLFGWTASKAKHKTEYPVDQLAGLYILHIFPTPAKNSINLHAKPQPA